MWNVLVLVSEGFYRVAKIYCHINQCNASVQYFAILHDDKYCTISEKPFSHTIKQLLHQYHKILALCNIKRRTRKLVLLEYCTQPIFCGIDAITDKYSYIYFLIF